ncbi:unnamed protein product, partial [Rotaria magnacalcarata]
MADEAKTQTGATGGTTPTPDQSHEAE